MYLARLLQPNLVLGGSILSLSPDLLQRYGLKGLILDVDDTLVPWREAETSPELLDWMVAINNCTFTVWLVSNNVNAGRISRIAGHLAVPYLTAAGKPSRRKLRQALKAMQLPPHQVAMVGDRLFTDVLAGNRVGLFTILVEPINISPRPCKWLSLRRLEVCLSQNLGVSFDTNPDR